MANRVIEKYIPVVRLDGLQTNKNATFGINGATPTVTANGPVIFNSVGTANNVFVFSGLLEGVAQTLAPAATVAFTPTSNIVLHTPGGNETINFTAGPGLLPFATVNIEFIGTGSNVVTFGTGFKSTGTLTLTNAKINMTQFYYDGTNLVESSRTAAM